MLVGEQRCEIDTDFRACLLTLCAFENTRLTQFEKQSIMVRNLYLDEPADKQVAMEQAAWFLNGGEVISEENASGPKVCSFSKDASFIFAAFRQTHGIDLETAEMHWWKFLALFMDLGSETTFCNLVALRKRVKTGKATKEERAVAREMGDLFDVPDVDTKSLEDKEREAEFFALVEKTKAAKKERVAN